MFKKGERIFTGNNYTLEADDCDTNKSELEFVTSPLSNREEVISVIGDMVGKGRSLIEEYNEQNRWIQLHGSNKYWINPVDQILSAHPQVTFGLGLDKIIALKDGNVNATSSLDGLVQLIKTYMGESYGNRTGYITYPKMITDGFLLARTDFVHLYRLAIQGIDDLSEDSWLNKFNEYDLDENLFPEIHDEEGEALPYIPPLTRRKWLVDMHEKWFAKDQLTKIRDSESMGKLGNRKDTLPDNSEAGIFEYRREQTQCKNINEWYDFALQWYERIKQLGALP